MRVRQASRDDHDRGDHLPRYPLSSLRFGCCWHRSVSLVVDKEQAVGAITNPIVTSGVILIAGLGILATYTGFVIGQFKLAYPPVHNMADAGEVMLGAAGRELFGFAQILFLVFVMGSHILTFSIMLNVITGHGACSIAFGFVGFIVCLICTLPRTLRRVNYMAIVSFISIIAAVVITMAGVGSERPGDGKVDKTVKSNLYKGFEAVTNIIVAYAGTAGLLL